MLTATFGVVPGGIPRPEFLPGVMKKKDEPLLDGPRWVIGPWNWADDNQSKSVVLSQQFFGSPDGLEYQHWLGNVMGQAMQKWRSRCMMGGIWAVCMKDYKGWSVSEKLPIQIWKGKVPLAKTAHPVTGEDWAFYAEFSSGQVKVSFKKVEKGWLESLFGAIWDAITTVFGFIVKAVGALFEFLKNLGCALARPYLDTLGKLARGETTATPAVKAQLTSAGVKNTDIDKVASGGVSSEAVLGIANVVAAAVCGAPNTTTYPAGSVTAFDPSKQLWLIAAPEGAPMTQLKDAGLGLDTTKKYVQIGAAPNKPTGLTVVTLDQYNDLLKGPWWMRPTTWVLAAVGVAAVGTGTYYAVRKRKAA